MHANIVGPSCSLTSSNISIAACPLITIVFCLGQLGDVERGVAEPHFRFIYPLLTIYRLLDRRLLNPDSRLVCTQDRNLTANSDP
jgi:hypothetical protein